MFCHVQFLETDLNVSPSSSGRTDVSWQKPTVMDLSDAVPHLDL